MTGAIGSVVGTTVVMAAVVFVLVSNLSAVDEPAPQVSFSKDVEAKSLYIVTTDAGVSWGALTWSGDCTMIGLNGGGMPTPKRQLAAGDQIMTDCGPGDLLQVTHRPSGTTIYDAPF